MPNQGDIALVVGGSRGIGRAIVTTLAKSGYRVVFTYRSAATEAEAVVAEVAAAGGHANAIRCDISHLADIEALFACIDAERRPLRVVVNNGAVWGPTPLDSLAEAVFDDTVAVNLKGPLFVAKYAAARTVEGGRIIFVTSVAARMASPDYLVYSATKAGVNSIARGLAVLLGPRGITVNAIAPGFTATDMADRMMQDAPPEMIAGVIASTALGRMGRPIDIANAIGLLVRPEAGWITGQTIECTGGLML